MNILIATEPDDHHAILVKLALEKTGHLVDLLFTADHPTKQKNTIFIDNVTGSRLAFCLSTTYQPKKSS